jgi:integrase
MSTEISVKVTKFRDRKCWLMYYDDPLTGKRITKTTKEKTEREARKAAGKWESELREGRYKPKSNVTWAEFRERFLQDHLADAPEKTFAAYVSSLNAVQRHVTINRLAELTAGRIAFVAERLRKPAPDGDGLSVETARSYLTHLRAALNWAHSAGMVNNVPAIILPKRAKGAKLMKGRPITAEEYERMLEKVAAGLIAAGKVPPRKNRKRTGPEKETVTSSRNSRLSQAAAAAAPAWRRFLTGLWWSGLRLTEAVTLSWDDERFITVDTSGDRPRLRIAAGQDKSGKARTLPLAPEFAEMLLAVPREYRTGPVFPLPGMKADRVTDSVHVSRVVAKIGEAAGVKVDTDSGKFASAHDFRRAFGIRWAVRVMPAVLKELMRHSDISTTMKYYAGQDVSAMEDAAWKAIENINRLDGGLTHQSVREDANIFHR